MWLSSHRLLATRTPTRSLDRSAPRNPRWCRSAQQRSMCHRPGKCGSLIPKGCSRCRKNRQPCHRGSWSARILTRWWDSLAQGMSGLPRCSIRRCPRYRSVRRCWHHHPCHLPGHPAESQGRLELRRSHCHSGRRLHCRPIRHYCCRPHQPRRHLHCRPSRHYCCRPHQPRRRLSRQPNRRHQRECPQ